MKYIVKQGAVITQAGLIIKPGEEIELTDEQYADPRIKAMVVSRAAPAPARVHQSPETGPVSGAAPGHTPAEKAVEAQVSEEAKASATKG